MSTLCVDPVAGAAGNMILAALFDLGADPEVVVETLHSTGIDDFELTFSRKQDRHHLEAAYCDVRVLPASHHDDHHEHHHHEHPHRRLNDIEEIITRCSAPGRAKQRASAIFQRLAEAEAGVHGTTVDQVHFHEVGAVDAIVDILGSCVALEQLNVNRIYCAPYKVGMGTVVCAHGKIPVPAPATVRLLQGSPVQRLAIEAELTTPTGAAILTTLSSGDWTSQQFSWKMCGVGHGDRDLKEMPNIIRMFLCEEPADNERIEIIETDIDDQSSEMTAALAETLRTVGALDVSMTPIFMKKGRLGVRLTVLSKVGQSSKFAQVILNNASTIGVRVIAADRLVLPRQETVVETPWGELEAKAVQRENGVEIVPEFESARDLAEKTGVPLRRIMHAANRWQQHEAEK